MSNNEIITACLQFDILPEDHVPFVRFIRWGTMSEGFETRLQNRHYRACLTKIRTVLATRTEAVA